MNDDKFEIDGVKCIDETKLDIKIYNTSDMRVFWVPKSHIDDDSPVHSRGDSGKLIITNWFAIKEGLDGRPKSKLSEDLPKLEADVIPSGKEVELKIGPLVKKPPAKRMPKQD
jgi:hypothetical protein